MVDTFTNLLQENMQQFMEYPADIVRKSTIYVSNIELKMKNLKNVLKKTKNKMC